MLEATEFLHKHVYRSFPSIILYEDALVDTEYYLKNGHWFNSRGCFVGHTPKEVCEREKVTPDLVFVHTLFITTPDNTKKLAGLKCFTETIDEVGIIGLYNKGCSLTEIRKHVR